jgi:hypothetical protein
VQVDRFKPREFQPFVGLGVDPVDPVVQPSREFNVISLSPQMIEEGAFYTVQLTR